MLNKLITTSPTWFTLPLRLALGAVMVAHGAQKVLGSFNGPGFKTFIAGNTPFIFMRPAWFWLGAAALSELLGGLFLVFGLLTRVATFFITCTMLTAIVGFHLSGGFFAANGGYEYPLSLFAMALALLVSGGGQISVDRVLTRQGDR